MPITPGGRVSPDAGDDYDLVTDLAAMQVSNEVATNNSIGNLNQRFVSQVANVAARSAIFPTPVHGNRVFRNDVGYEETYLGLYNATTNVGGASVAGWYPTRRAFVASRTGAQSIGAAGWVVLSSAISQTRNDGLGSFSSGVFTVTAPGTYRISASVFLTTSYGTNSLQITRGSAAPDTAGTLGQYLLSATGQGGIPVTVVSNLAAGDAIRVLFYSGGSNTVDTVGTRGASFSIEKI